MAIKAKSKILFAGVSAVALAAVLATTPVAHWVSAQTAAYADEDGDGGGKPEGAGKGTAGHEEGSDDHGSGGKPTDTGNGPRAGEGEPDESDGKGPQASKPDETGGGRPVWASEGIPEVELGRLNVARSPEHVLDRAYEEALASFTADMVDFYNMSLSEVIEALSLDFENQTYIDSPLQNLALLKDALDGTSVLNSLPQVSNDNETLMAIFLGTASDKTVSISPNTVLAIATIYGFDLTDAQIAELAADAEAVRIALLAGHG